MGLPGNAMDGFREIPTELWLCLDDVCGRLALTALTLRSAGFPAADSAKHTTERTHFIIASLFTVSSP